MCGSRVICCSVSITVSDLDYRNLAACNHGECGKTQDKFRRLTLFRSLPACQRTDIEPDAFQSSPVNSPLVQGCRVLLCQSGGASVSQAPPHGIGDINPGMGVNCAMSTSMSSLMHFALVQFAPPCPTPCRRGVARTIARQVTNFLQLVLTTWHGGANSHRPRTTNEGTIEGYQYTLSHRPRIGLPNSSPIAFEIQQQP